MDSDDRAAGAAAPGPPAAGRAAFTEGLAAAGLAVLFFWGFRLVPLLGAAAVPCGALPLVRYACRRGAWAGALASLAAAVASGALAYAVNPDPGGAGVEAALAFVLFGSLSLAGGASRRRNPSHVFLVVALVGGLAFGLAWSASPEPARMLGAQFDARIRELVDSSRKSGADAAAVASLQGVLTQARTFALGYAPGLLAGIWALVAAVAYFGGRRLATPSGDPPGGDFSRFSASPLLAALFVAAGAGAIVARGGSLARICADVLLPVLVLYFLCGLSIIAAFARRFVSGRAFRVLAYVLAAWFPVWALTATLGLLDWYFDFRKRIPEVGTGRNR